MSDSQPIPEETKANPSEIPEEKSAVPQKGQFSARGGRGGGRGGSHTVKYVKKGEETTGAEPEFHEKPREAHGKSHKGERKPRENREREKEVITLDSVIPEKPKKHDILKEPSEEEHKKQEDAIEEKINALYERLKKYSKEMKDATLKTKQEKDKVHYPLKDLLAAKMAEHKRVNEEFKVLNAQINDKENLSKELFAKEEKYRKNLKKFFKKDEIEDELRRLIDLQKKGDITLAEEKVIVKQIAELERSLPFAAPLEVIMKEREEIRAETKTLRDQRPALFAQRDALRKDIDEIKTDIENRKKEKDEILTKLDPIIESKKEDYRKEIEDLKQQRRKLRDQFEADLDAYYAQQRLLQRIEWMTKVKNRLRREEERKKREEEDKKLAAEEKKEAEKVNVYEDEINLCDLLTNYCQNLIPKSLVLASAAEKKTEVLSQAVQDEWKKEKITVLQSKKDSDGDFFAAKGKKKKDVKRKEKEENVNEKHALQHQLEILGYFERLKVAPPLFANKLEETIKELAEKKLFYQGQPLVEVTVLQEKRDNEFKNEKTEEKKPENKRTAEKEGKEGIELNETEFPTI